MATSSPFVIHASTLNRVAVCAASHAEAQGKPSVSDEYASMGQAFHELMRKRLTTKREDVRVAEIASIFDADVGELQSLSDRFTFDPAGGEGEVEVEMWAQSESGATDIQIVGRLDYRKEVEPGIWDVVDYKTTRQIESEPEPHVHWQLLTYGLATFYEKKAQQVRCSIAFVRRGDEGWTQVVTIDETTADGYRYVIEEAAQRALKDEHEKQKNRRFTVSRHCRYCPGRPTCPAVRLELLSAINALRPKGKRGYEFGADLDFEDAERWLTVAKLASAATTQIRARLREAVDAFGPIDIGDGKVVDVRASEMRTMLGIYDAEVD